MHAIVRLGLARRWRPLPVPVDAASDNGLCATLLVRRSHPGQSVRHENPCLMKPLKAGHKRVDLAALLEEGT